MENAMIKIAGKCYGFIASCYIDGVVNTGGRP